MTLRFLAGLASATRVLESGQKLSSPPAAAQRDTSHGMDFAGIRPPEPLFPHEHHARGYFCT